MNEVRKAISTTLAADSTLTDLLGGTATQCILAEDEVINTTPRPFIVVRYDGSTGTKHFAVQTWTVLCAINPKVDTSYKSSLILKKVRTALDLQHIAIDTDSGIVCGECDWFMDIPTYHDMLFDAFVEGQRYKIFVRDI